MKKFIKVLLLIIVLTICLFIISDMILGRIMSTVVKKELVISHAGGFYDKDFTIEAVIGEKGTICYTTDCSEPMLGEGNTLSYTAPISVEVTQEQQLCIYKFKVFYEDGTESDIYTHTYFTGTQIKDRYTTPVLSITGKEEDLFGYEEGIFVRGRRWDEFLAANPDTDIYSTVIPANYHMDVEKKVSVELFDSMGDRVIGQNGGVKIAGAVSRAKNQKSFRLYARREYDQQNDFDVAIFEDNYSSVDGTVIDEYKRLLVRNSGNDNGYGFIRDELTGNLAKMAGFLNTQEAKSVSVYINGSYQGVYWLQEHYDETYFKTHYGEYTGQFTVLEGGDSLMKTEELEEWELPYADIYNTLCTDIVGFQMEEDEVYNYVDSILDVENYLQYCAIQNYIGNIDWPENNCKVYRYVSEEGAYKKDTVFDGRFRYLLYDTDYAFGLLFQDSFGITADSYTLYRIANKGTYSDLFSSVIARQECRNIFINYTCDLMNGAMSAEIVEKELTRLHQSRYEELRYMMEETDILKNSLWESDDIGMHTVQQELDEILDFAVRRPEAVILDIQNIWEKAGNTYKLHVTANEKAEIFVNSLCLTDEFTGTYFENIPVTVKAVAQPGYDFDCWYVNGKAVTTEELILNAGQVSNGEVKLSLGLKENGAGRICITELKSKGEDDYVVLTNLGTAPVSTDKMYISDSSKNLMKYKLPQMIIQPEQSIVIFGSKYTKQELLSGIRMEFSLRTDEIFTLYSENDGILEQLVIPNLCEEESIYKKDIYTGKFYEIIGMPLK